MEAAKRDKFCEDMAKLGVFHVNDAYAPPSPLSLPRAPPLSLGKSNPQTLNPQPSTLDPQPYTLQPPHPPPTPLPPFRDAHDSGTLTLSRASLGPLGFDFAQHRQTLRPSSSRDPQ